ncbi:MAG: ABC transporter permease [Dehalococcoidales bacterium]|nr:ABC transporter permease [Dehalococcoidales bacterium]
MNRFAAGLKQLTRYPSAFAGVAIILLLVGLAGYAVISVPYSEAIRLWRGGEGIWDESPRNAVPKWVNLFRLKKLPETIVMTAGSDTGKALKTVSEGITTLQLAMPFNYKYDDYPSELTLFLDANFDRQRPQASIFWLTPDGREILLGERSVAASEPYRISLDQRLSGKLGGQPAEKGLFADPEKGTVLKGDYEVLIKALLFEDNSEIQARLVIYGKAAGLAGTDNLRRDLWIALLWGTPIALAFGLIAAAGSTVITLIIAAIGAWYGGWVDAVIQRITELNAILPALPILILIGTFYSRSIWVMLGVIILLGIFSLGIKVYRSIFLQVKDAPYIEAARAYGASNLRIVLRYLVPRVLPMLIPQFVLLIPSLVFLEAALAFIGLGDPVLPTWGKVLNDAFQNGALYKGYYYWVVMPSFFLMLTGFGFAMLGYALDRIFNPRLRIE